MTKFSRILALVLLAGAVILAILAFHVGRHDAARRQAAPGPQPAPARTATGGRGDVLVATAARTIRPGTAIVAEDVRLNPPRGGATGAYTRIAPLIGRVPARAIAEGEVLRSGDLLQGLALQLQAGERALAVPVSETSAAGDRIRPGDYVDVFFSMTGHDRSLHAPTQSRLLLARVRVLAFGDRDLPAVAASSGASQEPARRNGQSARSAVLAVPVESVNALLLSAQKGTLSLALRNPVDPGMPQPDLFPSAAPMLAAEGKAGDEAVARSPENRAYAGIDTRGLARPQTQKARVRVRPRHTVTVVRGARSEHLSYIVAPKDLGTAEERP